MVIKCSGCKKSKDENLFYKHKNGRFGRKNQCIQCEKEYKERNKDRLRIYIRDWKRKKRYGIAKKTSEKNLLGRRFTRLTVVKSTNKRLGTCVIWECLCDCGKTFETSGNKLLFDKAKSCGCLKEDRKNRTLKNTILKRYKDGARKRKIKWDISDELAISTMFLPCFYCGSIDKRTLNMGTYTREDFCNGIDRVDNSLGYMKNNIVPCCRNCNTKKGSVTINIMKKVLDFIIGNR